MLHWFALTDAYYWFDFDGLNFPKYSDEIMVEWGQSADWPYIDYQFARIFWDIYDLLPYIENPVPDDIFETINSIDKLEKYQAALKNWLTNSWDKSEEQYEHIYDTARSWLYARRLDFGYLVGGPDLFFIRNKDKIHIYWITDYRHENGIPFWKEVRGEYCCDFNQFFIELVKGFKRFGLDMQKQILNLAENKLDNIKVDMERIRENQTQYEDLVTSIEKKQLLARCEYDWNNVREKIKEVIR